MSTCYMCGRKEVSKEHIPPKCLFPEYKDVKSRDNFRKNLITVPSCEEHNSKKSGDDEFLMYVLVSELMANNVATSYMVKKLKRSIERNPNLASRIFTGAKKTTIESKDGCIESLEIPLNLDRLNNCLDHISRGIYFHETKTSWLKKVVVIPDFVYFSESSAHGHEAQATNFELGVLAKILLSSSNSNGENADVFSYKYLKYNKPPFNAVAQAEFYKNCVVTMIYIDEEVSQC